MRFGDVWMFGVRIAGVVPQGIRRVDIEHFPRGAKQQDSLADAVPALERTKKQNTWHDVTDHTSMFGPIWLPHLLVADPFLVILSHKYLAVGSRKSVA